MLYHSNASGTLVPRRSICWRSASRRLDPEFLENLVPQLVPHRIPIRRGRFQLLPGLAARHIQHPRGHQPLLAFPAVTAPDHAPGLDEFADLARLLRADRVAPFQLQLPVAESGRNCPERLASAKLLAKQSLEV